MVDSSSQQYCLRWNNHKKHMLQTFSACFNEDSNYADVILATSDGYHVSAHRIVLSACSEYLRDLLKDPAIPEIPLIYLHDVTAFELRSILHFIYHGELDIEQSDIACVMKTAEHLQICGLNSASRMFNAHTESPSPVDIKMDTHCDTHSVVHAPPAMCQDSPDETLPLYSQLQCDGSYLSSCPDNTHSDSTAPSHLRSPYNERNNDAMDSQDECSNGKLCIVEDLNSLKAEPTAESTNNNMLHAEEYLCSGEEDTLPYLPLPRTDHTPAVHSSLSYLQGLMLATNNDCGRKLFNPLEVAILSEMRCGHVLGDTRCPQHTDTLECSVCSLTFSTQCHLRTHTTLLHTSGLRQFSCYLCNDKFNTLHEMKNHQIHQHEMAPPMLPVL